MSINNTHNSFNFHGLFIISFILSYFFVFKKFNWKKNRKINVKTNKQTYKLTIVCQQKDPVVDKIGSKQGGGLMSMSLSHGETAERAYCDV